MIKIFIINTVRLCLMGLGLSLSIWCFIRFILESFKGTMRGIHNISKCDDDLFDQIDFFRRGVKEDRNLYIKKIKIINYFYKPGGEVDKLVESKEIERLYNRKDFLEKRCGSHEHLLSIILSLWISIIVTVGSEIYKDGDVCFVMIGTIVIVLVFICLLFFRYRERGEDGTYISQIYKYELKCLNEKIEKIEVCETCGEEEKEILHTKQMIVNELVRKHVQVGKGLKTKAVKNRQKEIEKDIEIIEGLNLYVECNKGDIKIAFRIADDIGYLKYHRQCKAGGRGSEMKLKGDFKILGDILLKYNIISNYNIM